MNDDKEFVTGLSLAYEPQIDDVTTIRIDFANNDEVEQFNADLPRSLNMVRSAVGSPFATVAAPIGRAEAERRGLKPTDIGWHVLQRIQDHDPEAGT